MRTIKFNVMYSGETGTTVEASEVSSINCFDSAVSFMPKDYEQNIEDMGLEKRPAVLDDFCSEHDVQCFVYEYYEGFIYTGKPINIGKITVYYN